MRIALLLFALSICPLIAQDDKGRPLKIRILCFGYSQGIRDITLSGSPDLTSSLDLRLKRNLESAQHSLTIFKNTLLIGSRNNGTLAVSAELRISPKIKDALVVLLPSKDPEHPYRASLFDESLKDFPLGAYRVTNMSPHKIRLVVSDIPVEIGVGKSTVITKIKRAKNGQFPYLIFYQKDNKSWQRLATGYWNAFADRRVIQIAYKNPTTNRVEVRGYTDNLPLSKKAEAKAQNKN